MQRTQRAPTRSWISDRLPNAIYGGDSPPHVPETPADQPPKGTKHKTANADFFSRIAPDTASEWIFAVGFRKRGLPRSCWMHSPVWNIPSCHREQVAWARRH